jgi:hypothetical protein
MEGAFAWSPGRRCHDRDSRGEVAPTDVVGSASSRATQLDSIELGRKEYAMVAVMIEALLEPSQLVLICSKIYLRRKSLLFGWKN